MSVMGVPSVGRGGARGRVPPPWGQPAGPGEALPVAYAGEGRPLFWLVLRGLLLTVLTLGLYRFWMKARVRRYYWSAVRIDGQPLEFAGTGLEMFRGFLIAVVFLAVYLGLLQLLLSWIGLAVWQSDAQVWLNLSFVAVLPLLYYAAFRARRYLLSRTRWRGIRFGMDRGAADYMLRALGWGLLAVATLGLLVPLMDFRLRCFVTDRTQFGSLRFRQEGSWTGFLRPWLWVYGAILVVAAGTWGLVRAPQNGGMVGVIVIGYLALLLAFLHYRVASFRYAVANTRLGATVRFASAVRTGRILGIYTVGGILTAIAVSVVTGLLGLLATGLLAALGLGDSLDAFLRGQLATREAAQVAAIAFTAAAYVLLWVVSGAFVAVLVTQPILAHYVETLAIEGRSEIEGALQRPEDRMTEAEGLADALDVGAAF